MTKNKTDKSKKKFSNLPVEDKLKIFANIIVERLIKDQRDGKLVNNFYQKSD